MSRVEELDLPRLEKLVEEALTSHEPMEIVEKALRPAMEDIGEKFEKGEYSIAELILAAEAFKTVFNKFLRPRMRTERREVLGRVVIGTIEGDIHDIGKNIVAAVLEAAGFEVVDLGVDVAPEKFIEVAESSNANVIAISALLSTTMPNMKKVIRMLEERGIRDKYIVIVGGAPVTEEFAKSIGADLYGRDAYDGLSKLRNKLRIKR